MQIFSWGLYKLQISNAVLFEGDCPCLVKQNLQIIFPSLGRDHWSIGGQHEVDARIRHQIRLEPEFQWSCGFRFEGHRAAMTASWGLCKNAGSNPKMGHGNHDMSHDSQNYHPHQTHSILLIYNIPLLHSPHISPLYLHHIPTVVGLYTTQITNEIGTPENRGCKPHLADQCPHVYLNEHILV